MANRKFLTSVADVYGYDLEDNLVFTSKTLLDSSIEVSLGSNPVRGGRGNQLQYVYYHTGEMNFTLTDTQWNLAMLAATVGSEEGHSEDIFIVEDVVCTLGELTVTKGTPLAIESTDVFGWATAPDGTTTRVTFTGSTTVDSGLTTGETYCVRYYVASNDVADVNSITIEANMIPKIVRLVMEAQLNSADASTNKIGTVQIIAPRVTLSGAFSISMTADGVSNTPLKGMALAYTDPTSSLICERTPYYAKLIEVLDGTEWYDNVRDIAIFGGNVQVANNTANNSMLPIEVWAIPYSGSSFLVSPSKLTYASSAPTNFTFTGATSGTVKLVANVTNNTSVITVSVANTSLTDNVTYTVVNSTP